MRTNGEKVTDFMWDHPFLSSVIILIVVSIAIFIGINWWNNNVNTLENPSTNTSEVQSEQLPSETIQNDFSSQNNDKESISEDDCEPLFKVISADYYTGGRSSIYLRVVEDTQTGTQYIITSQGGICVREGDTYE